MAINTTHDPKRTLQLTIHRGAKQIGGSCVEISTATTRLILDVGLPLAAPSALPSRRTNSSRPADLPDVPGLFSSGPRVNAVLLSHAHSDHTGLLQWVKPEIPIYCSQGTSKMLMAGSIFAGQPKLDRERQRILSPRMPTRIGDITITGWPVDHSAFDSMALLIEADGKRLLYSGDLRLHGRKPGMARAVIRHAHANPVDVLLMEGTNISRPQNGHRQTEEDLVRTLRMEMTECPGLVLASFSPQHVDRFVSFYKAARRAGRRFVVDVYGALVWRLAAGQIQIPKLTAKAGIDVCFNQSFQQSWRRRNLKKIYDRFLIHRIELSEILTAPERYAMLFRPSMIDLDFKGTLPQRATCIYSFWPGYLVQPEYRTLRSKLAEVEGKFVECHTSGHIFGEDIVEFVDAVNPKRVVPIHTTGRSEFQKCCKNVLVLEDGEAYDL